MNYFQIGNQVVSATWSLASQRLKAEYQKRYRRNPSNKELENFRYILCDPKPSKKEMRRFYKGGLKHEKAKV